MAELVIEHKEWSSGGVYVPYGFPVSFDGVSTKDLREWMAQMGYSPRLNSFGAVVVKIRKKTAASAAEAHREIVALVKSRAQQQTR